MSLSTLIRDDARRSTRSGPSPSANDDRGSKPRAAPAIRGLRALLDELDALARRGPLEMSDLRSVFDRLQLRGSDLTAFQLFDSECYRRNRIRRTEAYEMLLICWAPGQESPVHDHRGSICAFQVLEGTCCEQRFERLPDGPEGGLRAAASPEWLEYERGTVCVSRDADIHRVANRCGERNLCTLHVYSPPLDGMRSYQPIAQA